MICGFFNNRVLNWVPHRWGDSKMARTVPGQETLKELEVLWITAGLGCDGETIAMTGATQPSIEDLVQGALPGIP